MTQTRAAKPKSLIGKALWVVRYRPAALFGVVRGYLLFSITRRLLPLFGPDREQVELGPNVRLQRLRCVHAEKPGAKIILGAHSIVYEKADIGAYGTGRIELGPCAVIGDARIACRYGIRIGARFITSWNVFIQDFDPHPVDPFLRGRQIEAICASFRPRFAPASEVPFSESFVWDFPGEAIEIGDDVWLGANVTILKGARIGSGCIVATGAVVLAGEYPENSIIGGNPARVVKSLSKPIS